MSRHRIFTDEVIRAIPDWVAEGASNQEIAEAIGCRSVGSFKMTCSRFGISLDRRRLSSCGAAPHLAMVLRRALSGEAWKALQAEARSRRTTPGELAVRLLECVAADGLFQAVADEIEEPGAIVQRARVRG
jgi:hypothetical protein